MEQAQRTRGRPRGSGIDDAALLAELHAELVASPDLRPTTAIKRRGITNESTIRRLRDKLKTFNAPRAPEQNGSPRRPLGDNSDLRQTYTTTAALAVKESARRVGQPAANLQRRSQPSIRANHPIASPEAPGPSTDPLAAVLHGTNLMAAAFATANLLAVQHVILWNLNVRCVAQTVQPVSSSTAAH